MLEIRKIQQSICWTKSDGLLDEIWRSAGRNLAIYRRKSRPCSVGVTCPGISGFRHNGGPWTSDNHDMVNDDDQSLCNLWPKIFGFQNTAICTLAAGGQLGLPSTGIKLWLNHGIGYLAFPVSYWCTYKRLVQEHMCKGVRKGGIERSGEIITPETKMYGGGNQGGG